MIRRPILSLILAPILVLGACSSSSPTRYWTIEPVSGVMPHTARAVAPVQVLSVHVPLAIDRLEIVQHDAANRVTVNDFDRWSAPPGNLIRKTLTQDLAARLPAGSVIFPDLPAPKGTRGIIVDLLDLRLVGGILQADMAWRSPAVPTIAGQQRLSAPAGTGDVAGQTEALGQIVAQLADAIAAATGR